MKHIGGTETSYGSFGYVFHYTDHLGNIRLSYAFNDKKQKLEILEENHYYPFGLKHQKYNSTTYEYVKVDEEGGYDSGIDILQSVGRSSFQYKYNGKEFQDELNFKL